MADNVSGIVLEIPSTVLDNIKKAGKEIATLEEISKRAAQKIEGHFSKQMVNGVQKFIDKVIEAQGKLGTLNVNVNIKDNGLSSLLQQLSQALPTINSMSGGIHNIGKESQSAALNLANVSEQIKNAFSYKANQNIDQLKTSIEAINNKLRDKKGGVSRPEDERFLVNLKDRYTQELKVLETSDRKRDENFQKEQARAAKEAEQHNAKMRRKNEEYHATQKQIALEDAARKKAVDSFTRKTDTQILSEQNKLLNERATLLKNIGNLEALKAKNTTLGNAPLNKDQADLMTAYKSRIDAVDKRLADIAAKYDILSEKGKKAYDTRDLQSYNKWQEINLRNEEKIGKARERAKSLLESSGKKSLQPSSEELTAQRKLESIYSRKLAIEKEIQAIQDRRKLSGTSQSAAETQYLNTLINQARTLKSEARTTAEGFEKINKAVKGDYVEKRLQMQARAAYDLAIAQEKVNREMSKEKPKPAGYQDTTKQVENVRLLQQMYNTLNAELNTLQNKRIQIRAEIDKKYEGQLNDLNKRIADFQKKMASPASTTKTRGYLSAEIDKLKAKIDEINATKITLKTSTGLDTSIAKAKSELASIATESAKAQKELASTTNANNALERQERKIASLRDKITALDVEIAKLNAKGQLKDSTGGLTAEGTRLIQRRIDLTAELEKKTQTAAQAQQASIAADKQKAEVYKRLTAEQDKLSASMAKAVAANKGQLPTVGTTERTAYDKLEAQRIANEQRMTQIAQQNIKEVNEFRLQRELKTQQDILSAFIQSEAQKKQIALQTVKDESAARAQAYSRYTQTYEGAMKYATKDSRTDTYQKREVAIKKLEAAIKNLSTADANYTAKQQNLITQLNRLKSAQEGVNVAMSKKPVQADTSKAAMDAAKNAKSLNDLKAAYERLKAIMSSTTPGTKEWNAMNTILQQTKTKIDSIRTSMGELKKQSNGLDNIMGQLKNRIAMAFSVTAITGFVNKMVQARAEMALQQTALRAMLQNKQEADRIYMEVQKMAMQSPFSVQQMTTFTKQLAAYRIEADKLVGTTKMLADVSAGLGVDMQRLILAYGQVKSANYLRATEVRQFTEAGLNIGGELAQYFTELKGKLVTVADVMEMISKRAVRFEDVEEVFKRVTSAGGIFYDMQKKQSETLKGQLQRIQDAMTLMFNDIGKGNEGMIMSVVKGIRELINNWRTVAAWIKSIVVSFGAYKAITLLATFANSRFGTSLAAIQLGLVNQKSAIVGSIAATKLWATAITTVKAALTGLATAALPTAIFAGIMLLINHFIEAHEKAAALREELDRIGSESLDDLNGAIANFVRLTGVVTDSNKTYSEHQEALEELKRVYGEIIPEHKLTQEYIQSLNGDYQELTATIVKYYQAQEYQKKYEAVLNSDYAKDVQKELEDAYLEANKNLDFGMVFPESQVKEWADTVANELSTGKIPRSLDALKKRTKEIFGKDIKVDNIKFGNTLKEADELAEKMGDISLSTIGATNAQEAFNRSLQENSEIGVKACENLTDAIEEQKKKIAELEEGSLLKWSNFSDNSLDKTWSNAGYISDEEKLQKEREELARLEEQLNQVTAARAELLAQDFKEEVEAETQKITDEVQKWWDYEQQMKSLEMQMGANSDANQDLKKKYDELKKEQEKCKKSADQLAKKYGQTIPWAQVQTQRTSNDLKKVLNQIATSAFPAIANAALKAMSVAHEAVLTAKSGVLSFVDSLIKLLPEGLAAKLPDVGAMIAENNKKLAALRGQLKGVKIDVKDVAQTNDDIYSDAAKRNIDKWGGDIREIDNILKQGADSPRAMADNLRGYADQANATVAAYKAAAARGEQVRKDWLKLNAETEKSMEIMEKTAKAAGELAQDIYYEEPKGSKKGRNNSNKKTTKGESKGEDKDLKDWQELKKTIKETADAYEKYRKTANKENANKLIYEEFESKYRGFGKKISDYFENGVYGLTELVEAYQKLQGQLSATTTARQKALHDLLLETTRTTIEIKIKAAEEAEKELKNQIDDMFANYELTKTLNNLGVDVNLAFLVGGEPMTLDDIKEKLQKMQIEDDGSDAARNRIKIYEDALKRVNDLEDKAAIERLKNYNKYLLESMSERVQIELKAQQEINKIRNSIDLDEFSKKEAEKQVTQKMNDDLAKFDFDKLKSSDIYLQVIGDLENASKKQIKYIIDRLSELKKAYEGLSPTEVKSIVEDMRKLEEELGKRSNIPSMISDFKTSISFARHQKELQEKLITLQEQKNKKQKEYEEGQKNLYDLKMKRDSIQDKESDEWHLANSEVEFQEELLNNVKEEIDGIDVKLNNVNNTIKKGEQAWKNFQGGLAKARERLDAIKESAGSIFEGLDSMGLVSDSTRDAFDSFSEIMDGIDKTLDGLESIDITKPFSIITGSVKAIGGIFSTIGGFIGIGDKKKERDIQKLQKKVENLEKAYERLGKAIEEAYTYNDYNLGYNQAMKNLEEQRKAINEQMALEKAKKKTDKDKLREYEDSLNELAEKEEELRKQRYEAYGSYSADKVFDEAQNFVSAWLDAYKETGDGLDALNEHWDEFLENLVLKQAASAVVSKRMAKYIDLINDAIDRGGTGLSLAQTFAQIGANLKAELGTWNEDLKAFFDAVGITGGQGELLLSDLQKGIQNITEPQAAAIEAYLNSMRFAVFEQNNILTEMLTAIQSQYGGTTDSPILNEVKAIRSIVASIDDRLSRVIVSRTSSNTTYAVKIV